MDAGSIQSIASHHYEVALTAQLGHWNMAGARFSELHQLTDDIYSAFIEKLDDVVEEFISHEDVEVSFGDQLNAFDNAGTPEECLSTVLSTLVDYVSVIYDALENEVELSPEDEDTLINLLHFADHWRWKAARNLE